jgi:transcriptional regulator with XRE-family HTH domain
MDTYTVVKNRLLELLGAKKMSIHKLAMESAALPSSIKNILYGKSKNPGVVTIKMLCDGLGITLVDFLTQKNSASLSRKSGKTRESL